MRQTEGQSDVPRSARQLGSVRVGGSRAPLRRSQTERTPPPGGGWQRTAHGARQAAGGGARGQAVLRVQPRTPVTGQVSPSVPSSARVSPARRTPSTADGASAERLSPRPLPSGSGSGPRGSPRPSVAGAAERRAAARSGRPWGSSSSDPVPKLQLGRVAGRRRPSPLKLSPRPVWHPAGPVQTASPKHDQWGTSRSHGVDSLHATRSPTRSPPRRRSPPRGRRSPPRSRSSPARQCGGSGAQPAPAAAGNGIDSRYSSPGALGRSIFSVHTAVSASTAGSARRSQTPPGQHSPMRSPRMRAAERTAAALAQVLAERQLRHKQEQAMEAAAKADAAGSPPGSPHTASPRSPGGTRFTEIWTPLRSKNGEVSIAVAGPDGSVSCHPLSRRSARVVLEHWGTARWLTRSTKQSLVVRRDAAQSAQRARTLYLEHRSRVQTELTPEGRLMGIIFQALEEHTSCVSILSDENAKLRERLAAAQAAADGFRAQLAAAEGDAGGRRFSAAGSDAASLSMRSPPQQQRLSEREHRSTFADRTPPGAAAPERCSDARAAEVFALMARTAAKRGVSHDELLCGLQERDAGDLLPLSQLERPCGGPVTPGEWFAWCEDLGAIGQAPAATLDRIERALAHAPAPAAAAAAPAAGCPAPPGPPPPASPRQQQQQQPQPAEAELSDDDEPLGSPVRPKGTQSVGAVLLAVRAVYTRLERAPTPQSGAPAAGGVDRVELIAALRGDAAVTHALSAMVAVPQPLHPLRSQQLKAEYEAARASSSGLRNAPAASALRTRLRARAKAGSWPPELSHQLLLAGLSPGALVVWPELELRAAAAAGGAVASPPDWGIPVLRAVVGNALSPVVPWDELCGIVCGTISALPRRPRSPPSAADPSGLCPPEQLHSPQRSRPRGKDDSAGRRAAAGAPAGPPRAAIPSPVGVPILPNADGDSGQRLSSGTQPRPRDLSLGRMTFDGTDSRSPSIDTTPAPAGKQPYWANAAGAMQPSPLQHSCGSVSSPSDDEYAYSDN